MACDWICFAQPLAVTIGQAVEACANPCSLIFVATEQDMLYAFKASSSSQTPVWSRDLAQAVGGTAIDCNNFPDHPMCKKKPNGDILVGPFVGVTGTPVIDVSGGANTNTLYVAEAADVAGVWGYYLVAVDITSGAVKASTPISGSVPGGSGAKCATGSGTTVNFDSNHVQRSALLLLNNVVYTAFGPLPETENGWLFGYSLSGSSFSAPIVFNSTPHGTGGGIWQSGAGPASDGSSIYVATANGTFDLIQANPLANDAGDSLLRLNPSNLAILDYYTPFDVFNYPPPNGTGLCLNDEDFGSGGVLVVPAPFTYNNQSVLVNADKQSNLYVTNRASLGGFNSNGGNDIQTLLTPHDGQGNKLDPDQGYWASPAYWRYTNGSTTTHTIYYSATTDITTTAPYPIFSYQLATSGASGPIPDPPTASTPNKFCQYSPTPSVSSNGTTPGTGIVWAIEHGNTDNLDGTQNPDCAGQSSQAALHAFNATTLAKLYDSRGLPAGTTGGSSTFSTPTIFNGRVYMGTKTGVSVFGICPLCQH